VEAVNLEDYIKRTVDAAPPLTPEQRDRIADLLSRPPRTLADLPAPDEQTARRLVALLSDVPDSDRGSEPLDVRIIND
jgi:hypothetical protein